MLEALIFNPWRLAMACQLQALWLVGRPFTTRNLRLDRQEVEEG